MKLICVLCEKKIEIGEPLLSNSTGELAHQSCVESRSEIVVQTTTVTILSPKIETPPMKLTVGSTSTVPPKPIVMPTSTELAKSVAFRVAHGIPVKVSEVRAMYEPACPHCDTPLGPVLKGAYSHYPDSRFCSRCVRFVEEPKRTSLPCDASTTPPVEVNVQKQTSLPTFDEIAKHLIPQNGRHDAPKRKLNVSKKRKGRR